MGLVEDRIAKLTARLTQLETEIEDLMGLEEYELGDFRIRASAKQKNEEKYRVEMNLSQLQASGGGMQVVRKPRRLL